MVKLLDDVALLEDLPEHGLQRGQVGTVVEELAPGVFEVEFSDSDGRTYALLPLKPGNCWCSATSQRGRGEEVPRPAPLRALRLILERYQA